MKKTQKSFTKEYFEQKYIKEGLSAEALADDLGCGVPAVKEAIRIWKLKPSGNRWADIFTRDYLVEQYIENGKTLKQIANEHGCGYGTVQKAYKRTGLDKINKSVGKSTNKTDKTSNTDCRSLENTSESLNEPNVLSGSNTVLSQRHAGDNKNSASAQKQEIQDEISFLKGTKAALEAMLHEDDEQHAEIQDGSVIDNTKTDIDDITVKAPCAKIRDEGEQFDLKKSYNIKDPSVKSYITTIINEDNLRELYINRKMSTSQIAKIYGVYHSQITNYMKKYGIERRNRIKSMAMTVANKEGSVSGNEGVDTDSSLLIDDDTMEKLHAYCVLAETSKKDALKKALDMLFDKARQLISVP